jgi:hypothetical protein
MARRKPGVIVPSYGLPSVIDVGIAQLMAATERSLLLDLGHVDQQIARLAVQVFADRVQGRQPQALDLALFQ